VEGSSLGCFYITGPLAIASLHETMIPEVHREVVVTLLSTEAVMGHFDSDIVVLFLTRDLIIVVVTV